MVFLNVQIAEIITGLDDANYVPEALTPSGTATATVYSGATPPATPFSEVFILLPSKLSVSVSV